MQHRSAPDNSVHLSALTQLRLLLAERFSEGELRTLCFDLGLDYDDLPTGGKSDKARDLVGWMARQGQLPALVEAGRLQRPDIPWPEVAPPATARAEATILVLAGQPSDTAALRLAEAGRVIGEALTAAQDRIALEVHRAPRPADVQQLFLQYRPQVVHFAGDPAAPAEITFAPAGAADQIGAARRAPPRALAALFELLGDGVRCVVLDGCAATDQVEVLARSAACVVGLSPRTGDDAANAFHTAFYRALAEGQESGRAYKLGCAQLAWFDLPEADAPTFTARDAEAASLTLFPEPEPPEITGEPDAEDASAAQFKTNVQQGGSVGQVININELKGPLTIHGAD